MVQIQGAQRYTAFAKNTFPEIRKRLIVQPEQWRLNVIKQPELRYDLVIHRQRTGPPAITFGQRHLALQRSAPPIQHLLAIAR